MVCHRGEQLNQSHFYSFESSFRIPEQTPFVSFHRCQTLTAKISILTKGVMCFGSVWNPLLFLSEVIFKH